MGGRLYLSLIPASFSIIGTGYFSSTAAFSLKIVSFKKYVRVFSHSHCQ